MAMVLLVRHGQAAFGSDHYDRLSDRGRQQARWLKGYQVVIARDGQEEIRVLALRWLELADWIPTRLLALTLEARLWWLRCHLPRVHPGLPRPGAGR